MKSRDGISRMGVIVTLFLITLGFGLLIPLIHSARQAARISICRNNLKQLGLALHNYHDTYSSFPPGTFGNSEFPPRERWSFYPSLVPFHSVSPRLNIDYGKRSNDPQNLPQPYVLPEHSKGAGVVIKFEAPHGFKCPNSDLPRAIWPDQDLSTYVGIAGVGENAAMLVVDHKDAGLWGYDRVTRFNQITGGTANTIACVETNQNLGFWYSGGNATIRSALPSQEPYIGKSRQFGGYHEGRSNFLFADGVVRIISDSIDSKILEAMSTLHDDGVDIRH